MFNYKNRIGMNRGELFYEMSTNIIPQILNIDSQ